ncbi:MAG: hypothetical protein ABL935_08175, partial [Nitrospiraceae bacterium]
SNQTQQGNGRHDQLLHREPPGNNSEWGLLLGKGVSSLRSFVKSVKNRFEYVSRSSTGYGPVEWSAICVVYDDSGLLHPHTQSLFWLSFQFNRSLCSSFSPETTDRTR